MRLLSEIDIESTEEEILKWCQDVPMMALNVQVRQMYMDYGINLLLLKQDQKLLTAQNSYNEKQLRWSRALTIGTWALVFVTLLLVKVPLSPSI